MNIFIRLGGAALAAAAITTLAACTDTDPVAEQTTAPTMDPSAEAGPTVSPGVDIDDRSTWTIAPDGVGPVRLGMPLQEVSDLFDTTVQADSRAGAASSCISVGDYDDDLGFSAIGTKEDGVETIVVEDPEIRTEDGVGTDSSVDDILAVWGDPGSDNGAPIDAGGVGSWTIDDEDGEILVNAGSDDAYPPQIIVHDHPGDWPPCFDS